MAEKMPALAFSGLGFIGNGVSPEGRAAGWEFTGHSREDGPRQGGGKKRTTGRWKQSA